MKRFLLLITLFGLLLSAMAQDISTGQLVYYPFSGDATDASSAGLFDGTVVGAALTEGFDGTANAAYSFDGINDQIVFGDIDLSTESFTISFWVKFPELPVGNTSYRVLSKRESCNASQFFDIAASRTTARGYNLGMELRQGTTATGSVNTGNVLFANEWFHVTFVKDNATHTSSAYINGLLVDQASFSSNIDLNVDNNAPLGVSNSPCIPNSSISPFLGSIDEIRIHNRVLTSQEIKSLVPFDLQYSYPYNGETMASTSSGVTLEFTDEIDQSSVDGASFSVSASTAGTLTATPSYPAANIIHLDFANGLPVGEQITVQVDGIKDLNDNTVPTTSISFTTASASESLVAHYLFDGNLRDTTDNELHFGESSSSSFVANRLREDDKAIQLATNQGATLATNDLMNVGRYKDFSISFWMKAAQGSSQRHILDNLSTGRFSVMLTSGGQISLRLASGEIEEVITSQRYDDNQWHHVTVTGDRDTEYKIYVNGTLQATQAMANYVNLQNLSAWHLNQASEGVNRYGGIIDDLRFYNRVLSETEAKDLAPIYLFTTPQANEVAARPDTDIRFEFGQAISAATATSGNFTITGSVSGSVDFTVAGGDSRVITLTPDVEFALNETVTVDYSNLEAENGELQTGSLVFETADVDKGLAIYYPFDGNANNAAGDDYDGIINGATLTEGFDGTSNSGYAFDGGDYISIGKVGLDRESFAFAFWVNRDDSPERREIIGQRQFCTTSQFFEISTQYIASTGEYQVVFVTAENDGGFNSYGARCSVLPGEWTHIVAERDAKDGVIRMYKNGELVQETAFASSYSVLNDATLAIGAGNACINVDGRGRFSGAIDDFRFYRRAVHPAEVAKLSDFMVEDTYPMAGAEKASVTSSIVINLNDDVNPTSFSEANLIVEAQGGTTPAYSVMLKGDTIRIKPDVAWPAGETLTVSLVDVESIFDEMLSDTFSFSTASESESLLFHLPFDGDYADASENDFTFNNSGEFAFEKDRYGIAEKAINWKSETKFVDMVSPTTYYPEALKHGTESDFTIMTWFKYGTAGVQQTFFNQNVTGKRVHAHVKSDGRLALRLAAESGAVSDEVVTTENYLDGYWHHVAFVADRDGDLKIIVDGYEVASSPSTGIDMSLIDLPRIGAIENSAQHFKGLMDDFKYYNRTFTEQEINQMAPGYASSSPTDGHDAIDLDQVFEIEFLYAANTATAIAQNFTIVGSETGANTLTVTGGGTRTLTITPEGDFVRDEDVTLSFTNLVDVKGNPIPDKSFHFEVVGINKGMFVYYPMSGDALNQVSDMYHGQITGATLAADRNGTPDEAYSLDGSSHISIGDLPIEDQSFAISFWMNRDDIQQTQSIMGYRATCNASPQMNLNCSWSSTLNSYAIGFSMWGYTKSGSLVNYGVSTPVPSSTWTHVSVVRDNSSSLLKIYINGNLEAIQSINNEMDINNAANIGIASGSACIGVDATRRFTGDIDEVRIYNRAISDAEAAELPNLVITPPAIASQMPDVTINEDAEATVIASVDTLFSSTDELTYTVSAVSDDLDVYIDGLELVVTPAADYNGSTEVSISASNTIRKTQTFLVTTTPVNDAPVVIAGENLDLAEDFTGVHQIAFDHDQPANEADQTVTYSIDPDPATVGFAVISFDATSKTLSAQAVENAFGEQVFTITANDGELSGSAQATVTVNATNDAPTFELSASSLTLAQDFATTEVVSLTDLSPDNETESVTYSIEPASVDFANVSIDAQTGSITVTSVSGATGTQVFSVIADDGQSENNIAEAQFTLEVLENQAPTIVYSFVDVSYNEDFGSVTVVNDIASAFADPDGDALTITASSDNNDVQATIQNGNLVLSSTADYSGLAEVTVTADDGTLTTDATFTATIIAVNDAPTVTSAIADQTATEDVAFSFTLSGNEFIDIDGDNLTYSVSELPGWLTFTAANLTFTGTPLNEHVGSVSLTVTATDGSLSVSDQFDITVANVNDLPEVINNPAIVLDEDAAAYTLDLTTVFQDVDGDVLTFSLTELGQKGEKPLAVAIQVVQASIDGNILTITPTADQYGNASINVYATDGSGEGNSLVTLSVTVNPVNDAPHIIDQPALTLEEDGSAQTLDLTTVFDDVDGDVLTYGLVGELKLKSEIVVEAAANVVTSSVSGSILTVTPVADQFGTQNITVYANDGSVSTNYVVAVTVTNVNDAPVAISQPSLVFDEDGDAQVLDLTTIFSDVDGESLSYSFGTQNGISIFAAQLNGPEVTVTPNTDANGESSFEVVATDGSGETASYIIPVTINAVNDAPEFSLSTDELTLEQDFTTTETIIIAPGDVPSDEQGQSVTYTVTPNDGSLVNISVSDAVISITAVVGMTGEVTFTVEANDGQAANATASQTFTIIVNEEALGLDDKPVVSIYPNPATEFVMIEGEESRPVSIFDLQGTKLKTGFSGASIFVGDLKKGLYLLQVIDENGKTYSEKLILK